MPQCGHWSHNETAITSTFFFFKEKKRGAKKEKECAYQLRTGQTGNTG